MADGERTMHGTTILAVRRGGQVVVAGDGQVTLGSTVMKAGARKVRRLYKDQVIVGFAGSTADAFTLFERFEAKLEKHQGHLVRAAIELTRDWRTDRVLRRLEAMLAVRPIRRVRVCGTSLPRATQFASDVAASIAPTLKIGRAHV